MIHKINSKYEIFEEGQIYINAEIQSYIQLAIVYNTITLRSINNKIR